MDGRRMILAMVMCFAIVTVHMYYRNQLPPEVDPQTQSANNPPANSSNSSSSPANSSHSPTAGNNPNPAQGSGSATTDGSNPAVVQVPEFKDYPQTAPTLENEVLRVRFTSAGASVDRVELLAHFQEDGKTPLELISPDLQSGRAFALELSTMALVVGRIPLDRINWELDPTSEGGVKYRYPLGGGYVTKTFTLTDGHLLNLDVDWPKDLGAILPGAEPRYELRGPERLRHDAVQNSPVNSCVTATAGPGGQLVEVDRVSVAVIEQGSRREGFTPLWAGLESNYFAYVLRPTEALTGPSAPWELWYRQSSSAAQLQNAHEHELQEFAYEVGFQRPIVAGASHGYEVFFGPKERALLAQYDTQGYQQLIDYGWFGFFIKIFLTLITLFESLVGNYGVAIIMLTVLVKLVLHPLNKRNQGTMQKNQKKMAKIQPQMKEIKERYKSDAMKANKEIQKLMQENGVNPAQMFGGCLMMFLQLPIWIGLYRTCSLAIELRQQPFLYISDLTQPDRLVDFGFSLPILTWSSFNLLPVLYVILTLVNQRMMPRSDDPTMQQQQKMMGFMMIAFGFIFYNFPAGLLLYFLTNSGLGIIEQKIIRAELKRAEEAEAAAGAPVPAAR